MFRVILGFTEHWFLWLLPPVFQTVITGILELTNGCLSLAQIESVPLRFLLAAGFLSFGGICVAMQTDSVIGELSLRKYCIGKLLQTILSIAMSFVFLTFFPLG